MTNTSTEISRTLREHAEEKARLDKQGMIKDANLAVAAMLGVERNVLLKKPR